MQWAAPEYRDWETSTFIFQMPLNDVHLMASENKEEMEPKNEQISQEETEMIRMWS